MPSLARKILIVAAIDGLILTLLRNARSHAKSPQAQAQGAVRIDYKSKQILPNNNNSSSSSSADKPGDKDNDKAGSLEAHGIAGLINVSPTSSFLIAITAREQVALIRQHPIYVITDVVLIPLSSQRAASEALLKARPKASGEGEVEDYADSATDDEVEEELAPDQQGQGGRAQGAGLDVIGRKGVYGRFAEKWFSKRGWTADQKRVEDYADSATDDEVEEELAPDQQGQGGRAQGAGLDVIGRKGVYGRFAEKWFSKRGWTADQKRVEGLSDRETETTNAVDGSTAVTGADKADAGFAAQKEVGVDIRKPENKPALNTAGDGAADPTAVEAAKVDAVHNLTPKLLHTTRLLLLGGSRSFYFSYEWDITRAWSTQSHSASTASLPLHKLVDPLYFWNHNLQKPFIESRNDHLVLPLMQGFVGQLPFKAAEAAAPPEPQAKPASDAHEDTDLAPETSAGDPEAAGKPPQDFTLTLISRRSTRRAGLRYLRRGVDDDGNVANSVETEQLVANSNWDHIFSYLQIRGSIPLYFQQSPYALKPKPVLLRTDEANAQAFKKHFKTATQRYGKVHAVSLVEKHGNEAIIGLKYEAAIDTMHNEEGYSIPGPAVGFSWFDFHHECRGMRFENVQHLFTELNPILTDFSYTEEDPTGKHVKTQSGVLRTNCMDCLDRTNVVQSAAARAALDTQLAGMGVAHADDDDAWFNRLWADNGDAVSKQYASTAALKGDFTRTRKRNYRGALTDFGLTLHRYYTNIVSDFFTQAMIDFLLGSVTASVFDEFEEAMMTGDPAVSMGKLRQGAVEVSGRMVVEDEDEVVRGGWTMLAPAEAGTLRSMPFREVVVLLTDRAVYRVGFEWALEKVSEFERIELRDVQELQWGRYIVSTLTQSSVDESKNVGFVVKYKPSSPAANVVRVNTRSLKSVFLKKQPGAAGAAAQTTKFMAFKVLPGAGAEAGAGSEVELLQQVCKEIQAARKAQIERERAPSNAPEQEEVEKAPFVVNRDVISLAEAKKSTGLLEQWGYSLRKSVWA